MDIQEFLRFTISKNRLIFLDNYMFYPYYKYSINTMGLNFMRTEHKITSLMALFSANEIICRNPKISDGKTYSTIHL